MNKTSIKMFLRKGLIFLMLLSLAIVVLQGCYPYDDQTVADSDVIATFFDDGADFSTLVTYAIPDTIYTFDNNGGIVPNDEISSTNANAILNAINNNLQNMGFTPVAAGSEPTADVVLFALTTSSTWVSGGYYGGYWSYWYPYYGWCYPVYYTYTTGSIFITMINPNKTGNDRGVWIAAINGVLSSSSANNTSRINSDINQAFIQSPYLRGSK